MLLFGSVDCIGILKLRNADVEQRIGLAKSKKKSTSARLIFRVNIPRLDGTVQTLQVASTPVICSKQHLKFLLFDLRRFLVLFSATRPSIKVVLISGTFCGSLCFTTVCAKIAHT